MYHKALSIYYGLAIFVLGTALFVFYPSNVSELTAWQDSVHHQLSVAWQRTITDKPLFEDVTVVYEGVTSFYDQSADAMIAMFSDPASDADIYYVFHEVYADFAKALNVHTSSTEVAVSNQNTIDLPPVPTDFMSQEPIYNIVPEELANQMGITDKEVQIPDTSSHSTNSTKLGAVSGSAIVSGKPVNSTETPWVTLQDNYTGQLYCLAVYDGTVNKYLGPCKNDYH